MTVRSKNTTGLQQLQAEVQQLKAALEEERKEKKRLRQLMADAIRIIFYSGDALRPLFQGDLAGLEPTADGTAVQMIHDAITVTVAPFAEEIRIIDGSGKVGVSIFTLTDGRLSKEDQTMMMGLIARIRAAASGGEDPVNGALSLTGVVASV